MDYSQIVFLFAQATLVALVMLVLFHLRKQLGIGVMYACLGLFQFVQIFLYSAVFILVASDFNVSPGSAVFFTATLFVLLMVYIKEDAIETKKIIYALFIVNIVMVILIQILNWHFGNSTISGPLGLSITLFHISPWRLFVSTITLFLDAFLIIILFEYISKKIRFLFLQICITMLIVVSFDTLFYTTLSFWDLENLNSIIISGLVSKGVFTIFYSILLYSYLRFFDLSEPIRYFFNIKDVFQPLTFKQKFESAEKKIKETAEMHRILTEHSNDLICLQELDSTFKYISPSIKRILGYDQSDFIGKQVFSIIHKDDIKVLKEVLRQKLFSHDVVSDATPVRVRHKNGHYVWLEFLLSPVYKDDEISYFVTSARDITQKVIANRKIKTSLELLEKSENSLKEASKVAKIGYQEYDKYTDTYSWSDYVYDIYGLDSRDQIPSIKEIVSIFDEESQQKIKEISETLITKGIPCDVELRCINLKGEEVWVRYVAKTVYNKKNEIIGRRGVVHNITEFKKAQLDLEHSTQKVKTSLELLENRKYSIDEASKVAKIGFFEDDIRSEEKIIWSDYLYYIFGLDPKIKNPSRKKLAPLLMDEENRYKMMNAMSKLDTKGVSFDIELEMVNLRKENIWIRVVAESIYDDDNKIVGRRGIMQDITDSKKAQLELVLSKKKIQTTLELLEKSEYSKKEASKTAKIGYHQYDILNDTFKWSENLYHFFGFDPKKAVPPRNNIIPLFDKASQNKMAKATLDLDTNGVPYDLELRIINLKNQEVWVRNIAEPVYNSQNKIVGRRGITQDITASKKAQLELELSKNKLEASLELVKENEYLLKEAGRMANIGYWGYDKETDSISWSDSLHKIYGTNPEDGVPEIEVILGFFNKESREKLIEVTVKLATEGTRFEVELEMINAKNEKRWILNIGEAIFNDKNEVIGRRGVSQDITQQKLAKQKNLIISENYKKLFDNATVSILNEDLSLAYKEILELKKLNIPNLELYFKQNPHVLSEILNKVKVVKVNKATLKLFKVSNSQEFIDNIENTFGEGANKVFGKFIEAIWNNKKTFTSEVNYKTLKGDEFAAVVSIPIPQTEIEQKTVPVSIQSIQSIKDAELAEKESLKKLKAQSNFITAMTENQPAGIIACDSEGTLVLFNKIAKEWHGIDALKISQEKWAESYGLYKPDGITLLEKHEIPLLQAFNGKKITNVEIVIKAKNQKPRNVVCNGTSFSDSTGNKLGALLVMNDITQQKIIENNLKRSQSEIKETIKELERSEFLFSESGRLARLGGWELKLPSQEIRWSNQVFEIHGIPVGEVPSLEECLSFYIDGSAEILAKEIEESIAEKKKFDLVLRFKNKQNNKLWINAIGYPLINDAGDIISLIGVFQDITQQKTRQNKLDAQNEKLNSLNKALNEAQEVSRLGSWEYTLATEKITWSKEMFNIFERNTELAAPNYEEHKLMFTEESFNLMDVSVQNCLKNHIPYNIELDTFTENGSLKHVILRGRVLKDKDNNVIGCYGTAQDITELKQASRKIEEAEKMYRLLTNNSNDLITLHKPDTTFIYISPSVKMLLGYEQAELEGEKALSIIHKEDVDDLKDTLNKRKLNRSFEGAFTCRVLCKDGRYIWLEFLSSPVYKGEEISHFVSSARDVTQSVLAKQKIQEYQRSLQKLTIEMTVIEEKQKKEIATNIHDHLSQSLVISKMKINELKKKSQLKTIGEDLNFIETHISEALENSRKITYELSPPVLYQLGIIEALNWLFDNVQVTHKIECVINSNIDSISLNEIKSILLYRSIQEVLMNAIKYANATLITLYLDKNKLGLDIFITDNGVGFDTAILNNYENHSGTGFGLFTVQERIKNIQGKFTIKSKINRGTTVKIFIPLSK